MREYRLQDSGYRIHELDREYIIEYERIQATGKWIQDNGYRTEWISIEYMMQDRIHGIKYITE